MRILDKGAFNIAERIIAMICHLLILLCLSLCLFGSPAAVSRQSELRPVGFASPPFDGFAFIGVSSINVYYSSNCPYASTNSAS